MGLIEVASGNSVWRGMDYYKDRRVKSWKNAGEGIYEGIVSGSGDNKYVVHIDKNHSRKSACNCPFADGRRVVCKHMIALYFTAEPQAAVEQWEAEEELREQEHYEDLRQYVKSLTKVELQEQLLNALVQLEERRNYLLVEGIRGYIGGPFASIKYVSQLENSPKESIYILVRSCYISGKVDEEG